MKRCKDWLQLFEVAPDLKLSPDLTGTHHDLYAVYAQSRL